MQQKKKSATALSTIRKFVHRKNNSGMAYMSHENLYSIGIKIFAARKTCLVVVSIVTHLHNFLAPSAFFLHP
jgi:hypothetical protein